MLDGMYAADFLSNAKIAGSGVVIFDGGRMHGGDASYFYKGKYRLEEKAVTAVVDVANYSGQQTSVFGALNSFRLTLKGTFTSLGFKLSGCVEGQPNLTIAIAVRKISELVDQ